MPDVGVVPRYGVVSGGGNGREIFRDVSAENPGEEIGCECGRGEYLVEVLEFESLGVDDFAESRD